MRRNWLRVFLLCVACAVCLHGNCAAGNNDDNWVRYYEDHLGARFVNDNSVKVREYNGRKYLLLATRQALGDHDVLFDVERKTSIHLLSDSKIHFIELTKKGSLSSEYQALLQWAEQKYPSLINELREHNKNHPLQSEASNAGTQTVTANGDYGFIQTFGNGPVQFVPRMIHDGGTRYYVAGVPANGFLTIQDRSCPPTAPDSHKPLYIIYDVDTYPSFSQNTVHAIFSYDDATNTFTIYDRYYDFSRPVRKIRIIDQNTVEGSYWDDETYSEDNPLTYSEKNPLTIQFKYVKALSGDDSDRDGCAWTGWDLENDVPAPINVYFDIDKYVDPSYMKLDYELVYAVSGWNDPNNRDKHCFDEVGLDGLFAFLARNGNVGYAPPVGSRVKYY